MLGGYRVAEKNPYTGHWIVRERNAHAWVEAFLEGHWQTLDATPEESVPQNRPHMAPRWTALADAIAERLSRWRMGLIARGPLAPTLVAGTLLIAWLSWRAWRARGGVQGVSEEVTREPGLPGFDDLLVALGERGVTRRSDETLEGFAGRVMALESLGAKARATVSAEIERYAAWRYGRVGNAEERRVGLKAARESMRG